MIVIKDTKENLELIIAAFDAFGVVVLTNAGREFDKFGHLISIGGDSVTKTYDVVHEDSKQGSYITHPEAFRGRWDNNYIDGLISLIPDTAIINLEFISTPTEKV